MKSTAIAIVVWSALAAVGCGGSGDTSAESSGGASTASSNRASIVLPSEYKGEPSIAIPKGPPPKELEIKELKKGTGAEAKQGDWVEINFVAAGYETRKKYETTWDNHQLFRLPVDRGGSVGALDKGVRGMRVGERRELIAPADLVYGYEAAVYVVDLVKIE